MIPLPDLSHLLKYPNATVQYESRMDGWELRRVPLTPKLTCWLWDYPSAYRNLRLVLRKLESLTEEEAKECFRLAYHYWDGLSFDITYRKHSVSLHAVQEDKSDLQLLLVDTGVMVSERVHTVVGPARINYVAVVDYLRSINIDIDNYLASDLAVEKEN